VTTVAFLQPVAFDFRTDFVRVTEESVLTPITILLQNKDLAFQEKGRNPAGNGACLRKITGINAVSPRYLNTISQDIPTALHTVAGERPIHQRIVPLRLASTSWTSC
jgi:hypothetical protein